jgi:hypothetical protein
MGESRSDKELYFIKLKELLVKDCECVKVSINSWFDAHSVPSSPNTPIEGVPEKQRPYNTSAMYR